MGHMPFTFEETDIEDVVRITTETFRDQRGSLCEAYERTAFSRADIENDFVLELVSKSNRGVLRGLHFQTEPYQQAKIVRCIVGEIFDVAVDLRFDSDTYGEYVSVTLSGEENDALFIPRGFAHGFVSLADNTVVTYKLDNQYRPDHESGVYWNDPTIDIDWPLEDERVVGSADKALPTLDDNEHVPIGGDR